METEASIFREELRDTNAYIALETAKLEGITITFQDRSMKEPVTVWAIPSEQTRREVKDEEIIEDVTDITFSIPRQHGCSCGDPRCFLIGEVGHDNILLFPPPMKKFPGSDLPSIHAEIMWSGFSWSVDHWTCDAVEAMFSLFCERHHPRASARV